MTTDIYTIKNAYPSQYAGIIQDGRILTPLDVWGGKAFSGSSFNVLNLPAASAMCPLTADQWALLATPSYSGMMNLFVDGTTLKYPDRFYCSKDKPASGFYDMWGFSSVDGQPAASDLYAITAAEYADRLANSRQQYYDTDTGKLADYIAPVVPVPLKDQAAAENSSWIQAQINEASVMGEIFSDDMKAYVKAIRAIASGADTTSSALPARPEAVFS